MEPRTREIIFLFAYLFLFAALFFLALYGFHNQTTLVNLGAFAPRVTNIFIMALSFLGILKTLWHIYRFETGK